MIGVWIDRTELAEERVGEDRWASYVGIALPALAEVAIEVTPPTWRLSATNARRDMAAAECNRQLLHSDIARGRYAAPVFRSKRGCS